MLGAFDLLLCFVGGQSQYTIEDAVRERGGQSLLRMKNRKTKETVAARRISLEPVSPQAKTEHCALMFARTLILK